MFIGNRMIEPKEVKISDINEDYSFLKIKAEITSLTVSESGTLFMKLSDETGMIDAIIFKGSIKISERFKPGDLVEVIGKPEKYKEKMEIIISRIEVLP